MDLNRAINYSKVYQFGLYLLFLIIPLMVFPWSDDSYLLPKWVLLELVTLWLATILFFPKDQVSNLSFCIPMSVSIPFFFLIVIHGLSFLYADSKTMAIHELTKWTFLFILYLVILRICQNPKSVFLLVTVLLAAGGITAFWTFLQDYHYFSENIIARLPDWRGYLVAGLGNSDYVAGFLVSLFPVALGLYFAVRKSIYRWLLLLFLILSYAALIITWSVGSNAGLIIGLLVMAWVAWKTKNRKQIVEGTKDIHTSFLNPYTLILIPFLLVTLFYVIPNRWNGRYESIFQQAFGSNRWKEGGSTRVVIWLNTLEIIKKHPVLGIGTGNFTFRYLDTVSPKVLVNPHYRIYAGEYTNAAHNEILQTWAEVGIPGVLLLLWLFYQYFSITLNAIKKQTDSLHLSLLYGGFGGMVALVCYGLMSYPFHLPATSLSFLMLLSIPTILSNPLTESNLQSAIPNQQSATPSWYRILRTVTLLILLLVLSVWILCPLIGDIYFRNGKMENAMGDIENAMIDFEKAGQWADHADAEYNLGQLLFSRGRVKEALEYFQQSAKQRKDKYIYMGLANCYYFLNQPEKAIDYLKILTHRNPDNANAWQFLWMAYHKVGKTQEEMQAYQQLQKLTKGKL